MNIIIKEILEQTRDVWNFEDFELRYQDWCEQLIGGTENLVQCAVDEKKGDALLFIFSQGNKYGEQSVQWAVAKSAWLECTPKTIGSIVFQLSNWDMVGVLYSHLKCPDFSQHLIHSPKDFSLLFYTNMFKDYPTLWSDFMQYGIVTPHNFMSVLARSVDASASPYWVLKQAVPEAPEMFPQSTIPLLKSVNNKQSYQAILDVCGFYKHDAADIVVHLAKNQCSLLFSDWAGVRNLLCSAKWNDGTFGNLMHVFQENDERCLFRLMEIMLQVDFEAYSSLLKPYLLHASSELSPQLQSARDKMVLSDHILTSQVQRLKKM